MLHKKRTSLFAALLLLAMLCLAGCGSTDNQAYVGKWNMTGGKANGVTGRSAGVAPGECGNLLDQRRVMLSKQKKTIEPTQ